VKLWVLVLPAAMLGALPAQGATPPWHGVWQGTIGTLPVRACLQQRGGDYSNGSYYYLRQLKPISLQHEDNGTWTEHVGGGEAVSGTWTIAVSGARLSGQWRGGKTSLPIELARVAIPAAEEDPCGSDAFVAPRVRPIRVTTKPASKAGLAYAEQTYLVGPSFEDVSITSFSYPATRPGDAAINAALRLDPAKPESDADYLGCMKGQLGSLGTDGDFAFSYEPALVTPEFLSVAVNTGGSCGGAHPSTSNTHLTFDRTTGKKADLQLWFNARALEPDEGLRPLTPALKALVMKYFPTEAGADADCRGAVAGSDYWDLAIHRRGIAFTPSLPHVAQACTDTAVVPFGELAPFLSPAGQNGAARLRK
jgi:hypothetical protein